MAAFSRQMLKVLTKSLLTWLLNINNRHNSKHTHPPPSLISSNDTCKFSAAPPGRGSF